MSKFVDYSRVATTYDDLRRPDGADVEMAMIQLYCNKPLQTLHVLDAGCGTGNYSKAFLGYGVGQVTMLDVSIEMLEKAKAKLEPEFKAGNNVAIVPAKLPEMPLQNGTVDVVVFNFVLHHLVSNPDGTTFPEIEKALAESHRVLKTGGIICIMTILPSILKGSAWYASIRTSIADKAAKRYPTVSQFDYMFVNTMFQRLNVVNIFLKEMLNAYRNPEGPLDKDWRDATVFFYEATEEELQYVQDEVRRMKDAGTLEAYMNEHDKTNETGCLTLVFARAL